MKVKIDSLKSSEIKILSRELEVLTFPNDCELIYENQIPTAGIALVDGVLELVKRSKVKQTLETGHILGISEILLGTPLPYGCRVKANSKIILLGKSYLMEAIRDQSSFLSKLLTS